MKKARKRSLVDRFLGAVERIGNLLPHPATLFVGFALPVVIAYWMASLCDISVIQPGTGETIRPMNLVSKESLDFILSKMVKNFTDFAPLGTVLVSLR